MPGSVVRKRRRQRRPNLRRIAIVQRGRNDDLAELAGQNAEISQVNVTIAVHVTRTVNGATERAEPIGQITEIAEVDPRVTVAVACNNVEQPRMCRHYR